MTKIFFLWNSIRAVMLLYFSLFTSRWQNQKRFIVCRAASSHRIHVFLLIDFLANPAWTQSFVRHLICVMVSEASQTQLSIMPKLIRYLLGANGDRSFVLRANIYRYCHATKPSIDNLMCHNHDERNFMCVAFPPSRSVPARLRINILRLY